MDVTVLDYFNPLIKQSSDTFKIDPLIIKAIILTESNADIWAYRYEDSYAYLVNPRDWADHLSITLNSEIQLQKTSIGLMQPMGGVCREYGFTNLLSKIFQPELSIYYGCMHLQKKVQKFGDDPATMYAAYNAGSVKKTPGGMFTNQRNVDRFMTNFNNLNKLETL